MITVNTHEAKSRLSELLAKIEKGGETVTICRHGRPIADVIPHRHQGISFPLKPHPTLGGIKVSCDLTAPLSDDEWPEDCR